MPAPDLALLVRAAREAGDLARRYFDGANKVWDKGGDDPVSEADLAVDEFLRDRLRSARPDYGWLSEESEDGADRLTTARQFVVDPIDGTRSFIAGERTWAHSLAVVEAGQPIVGAIYLPMKDILYAAAVGSGATLNETPIRASHRETVSDATLLASRPSLDARHWPEGVPPVRRHFRPSLAYRLGLVAEGRFDGMLTLRDSWEWDLAAGALIATEAGAAVTDRAGLPITFNAAHPKAPGIVAAGRALHAELIRALQPPVKGV